MIECVQTVDAHFIDFVACFILYKKFKCIW